MTFLDDFTILICLNKNLLELKGSLLIIRYLPSLNWNITIAPLYLFTRASNEVFFQNLFLIVTRFILCNDGAVQFTFFLSTIFKPTVVTRDAIVIFVSCISSFKLHCLKWPEAKTAPIFLWHIFAILIVLCKSCFFDLRSLKKNKRICQIGCDFYYLLSYIVLPLTLSFIILSIV